MRAALVVVLAGCGRLHFATGASGDAGGQAAAGPADQADFDDLDGP